MTHRRLPMAAASYAVSDAHDSGVADREEGGVVAAKERHRALFCARLFIFCCAAHHCAYMRLLARALPLSRVPRCYSLPVLIAAPAKSWYARRFHCAAPRFLLRYRRRLNNDGVGDRWCWAGGFYRDATASLRRRRHRHAVGIALAGGISGARIVAAICVNNNNVIRRYG